MNAPLKPYVDSPIDLHGFCETDLVTGVATLEFQIYPPNGGAMQKVTSQVQSDQAIIDALLADWPQGKTKPTVTAVGTVMVVDGFIPTVAGEWAYQSKVTLAAYLANPYLGNTQGFTVYEEGK